VLGKITADRLSTKNPDTKGQITIKAGESQAIYTFTKPYQNIPNVTLTPIGDPGTRYWVEPAMDKFMVKLSAPASVDIIFNYLVIE